MNKNVELIIKFVLVALALMLASCSAWEVLGDWDYHSKVIFEGGQ